MLKSPAMDKDLLTVVRATKYPLEAFAFVQRGLDFTVRRIHGAMSEGADVAEGGEPHPSRHITGHQLCHGLRDYALEQYGLMARCVLRHWNIHSSEDFGHIVFAMVDAGLMHKTNEDDIADFVDVLNFANAFTPRLKLAASKASSK